MFTRVFLSLLFYVAAAPLQSVSATTVRCPPVLADRSSEATGCDCLVFNYSNAEDKGVTITVLDVNGSNGTCGPLSIPGNSAVACPSTTVPVGGCGCKVSGLLATSRVSLVRHDHDPSAPANEVVVPCDD